MNDGDDVVSSTLTVLLGNFGVGHKEQNISGLALQVVSTLVKESKPSAIRPFVDVIVVASLESMGGSAQEAQLQYLQNSLGRQSEERAADVAKAQSAVEEARVAMTKSGDINATLSLCIEGSVQCSCPCTLLVWTGLSCLLYFLINCFMHDCPLTCSFSVSANDSSG